MKQKLFKKGWALLALILCVGIGAWAVGEASGTAVTDPVATVDGTGYATLQEAFSNAGSGSTVQLQKDVVATQALYISKPLTLDLNGKTISATATDNFTSLLRVSSDGEVVIADTKGNGGIKFSAEDSKKGFGTVTALKGTLTLKGGTISAVNGTSTSTSGRPNPLCLGSADATINIDGANIYAKGGVVTQAVMTEWAGSSTTEFGKLNIKSGTITAENDANGAWGVTGNTTLNMTGGTISVSGTDGVYGVYFPLGNTHQMQHQISGGTIRVKATGKSSTFDVMYGPAYISGGKFFLEGDGSSNVFSQNRNAKTNRYYRLDIIGGYFNKSLADAYLNKETRLVELDASSAEYAEGLRYKVERAKFHVDVTGYNPEAEDDGYREPIAVNANVYKDYSFRVRMPEKDDATVGADKADVNITMTGVQTLGLKEGETRTYTKTVETGVSGAKGDLSYWLSNVYAFNKVDVPVTVKAGDTKYEFTYNIGAYGETYANTILGTPSDENTARAAWHLLTSKVSASQDLSVNDTHFLFKRGAYILLGDEKLVFDQDYDFLKGTANLNDLFSEIKPYVHVEKTGLTGAARNKAVIYMPEGSTLGISSSAAVLTEDAFLTVDATAHEDLNVSGVLSGLRDQLNNSGDGAMKVAIIYLMQAFNQVVGLVDAADNVPVTLEFKKNKFHVDVTGYSTDDDSAVPVAVNADVYGDYSFDVSLPAAGSDKLTASKATVNVRMTDVSSLGVSGTRSYSKTVNTGLSSVSASLSGTLTNTYAFNGATCPVSIIADGTTKSFTYSIAGITADGHIVGTPSKTEDARAAWQLMTSKVSASQDASTDDTHFLFKKGAYLQVGDEKLVFLNDFDFLKGTASMETLFDGAQVKIQKVNVSEANTVKAVAYLPAGSTLGISSSAATVSEDVYVTMDGTQADGAANYNVTGFFTGLKSSASNAKAAILALVQTFDAVVGAVDALDNVSFTVEFKQQETKNVKFHVDVTGVDATDLTTPIAVNADVYADYSFNVSLPDPLNDNLSASKATINISMTGVQTLGLKEGETRSYSKTVNTGVGNVAANLHAWLPYTYAFNGATIPVTVREKGETGQSFTYNIAAIDDNYNIVGTPSDEATARAAWHLLTSKVSASQDLTVNDTHFLFKKGAYIQVGDEKLVFLKDFDFLKGTATLANLFSDAEGNVQIQHAATATSTAQVYLPAGSTLGVSSSAASLSEDATLTVSVGSTAAVPTGIFTWVKKQTANAGEISSDAKKLAIAALIPAFDAVVKAVDDADQASVVLEFAPAETKNVKFHVDVTGYDANNKFFAIPVTADVFADYSFDVALPDAYNDTLTTSKATLNIAMTGVQTLGLKEGETRSYSKTVETGVDGSAKLSAFLPNTYKFDGVKAPVEVIADGKTTSFTYNIAGINDLHIVGTPDNEDNARAAWHVITGKVSASQDQSVDDTHFIFKKGAYLQIGDERLVFLNDFDFLKGAASMETLFDGAQVRIEKVNTGGTLKAVGYLPAGSTLGVSSSAATVNEDVYVTMDVSGAEGKTISSKSGDKTVTPITGFFTGLSNSGNLNAKTAIAALVLYFDEVVGAVDQADEVNFKVEFKTPKNVKFHVDVTGVDADDKTTPIAVNADVYDDYSFKVSLPDTYNDKLSTSTATLNVSMTGVQSLGLKAGETRSYTKTVNTGLDGAAPLSNYLTSTYKFQGVNCPVTIKDANDSKSFEYQIAGINDDYEIVGTPVTTDGSNGTEAARAAWKLMTSHVSTQSGVTPEDSHFLFKKGAYIQVGNEKLVFVNDFDFLKGAALTDGASVKDLFANARVAQVKTEGSNTLAEVYLPEGSTLGLSSSAATVDQNVKVTMDGANLAGNEKIQNVFSLLKNSDNLDAKVAIGALIYAFDAAVGAVDEADNVAFTVEFTETEKPKFHVDVTGVDATDLTTPIAVNADVYGDYHFVVSLPFAGLDNLSASKATLNMSMYGVQTLGLGENETRSYSKTVETGIPNVSATLSGALKNTYAFQGAACPVTIKDATGSKSFTYKIAGINNEYQIVGTPSDEQAARDAWHFMVNSDHVSASKVATDDTHMLFKKGAYLQIGDEKLVFLDDFDFLKGAASMETLFDGANVRIEKVNIEGAETVKAQVYLPAGSTLGVSSSAATAVQDVYVTMDAIDKAGSTTVTDFFTSLKTQFAGKAEDKSNAYAAVYLFINYFDGIVGMVDQLDGVNFTVEFKQQETKPVKFHVDVTGEDATTKAPIAVNADVYNDYSFKVSLPDILNDSLSAGVATLNVSMTGVKSLGLGENETRNYSKTVTTGVEGVKAPLHNFLKKTYAFDGVEAPVTIKDATGSKSFIYNIAGIDENYNIIGTPSSTEDARAAWWFMVSHVKAAKTEKDDAHFLFKKGSYIQLGNEKLVFTKNFDFLKGGASMDKLFEGAEIEKQEATDSDNILAVYLPAGSTLALSTSAATVQQNVKVTMDGAALAGNEQVKDFWTTLQNSGDTNAKAAILALIKAFDEAIGEVDKVEKVNFTVEFTENSDVQYIDWDAADKTTWLNMVTDDDNAYNIDGDNLYGFRVNSNQENVNINFTRKFTENVWAAWIVPFDLTLTDDIIANYEFGYIEGVSNGGKDIDKDDLHESGVTFGIKLLKAGDVVKANLPYVVLPKVSGSKTFTVENTTLKETTPQATGWTAHAYHYGFNGVYVTKYYDGGLWYAVSDGKFQQAGSGAWLKPFRFYLEITDNDNNPYAIKGALRISIIDEATGINSINTDANGEMKIYDLQGRRVYNPTQKGVYIVNGRKVVMGR